MTERIDLTADCDTEANRRIHWTETVEQSYYFPMATTTVTIPDDLHKSLKQIADDEHRSLNATMIVAMTHYVQNRDRRAAIRAMAAEIARRDREILDGLA